MVAHTKRGFLVGATSAGPAGEEVLDLLCPAVHAAVPIEQLEDMIYAYRPYHGDPRSSRQTPLRKAVNSRAVRHASASS